MHKLLEQRGAVLPVVLLLLACTLLWSSIFMLTLSDAYAASNEMVAREQSRYLAYSGWNMALQQLETEGLQTDIQLAEAVGTAQVSLSGASQNLIQISSEAKAQGYLNKVTGTVRLLTLPWQEPDTWRIVTALQDLQEASLFLAEGEVYTLSCNCICPLAISQRDSQPLTVQVTEPITVNVLYIDGDLQVEAPLQAEAVYVSGQISGAEQIDSAQIAEHDSNTGSYRVQVVERVL